MSSKTTNLELNIEYRTPSTHKDLKEGYDANYNILDAQILYLLGTLENTNEIYAECIDLEEEGE